MNDVSPSNQKSEQFLPWWMWGIVLLEVLIVSYFAIATAIDPASLLPNVEKLDYLTLLYVTRNLTAVLGLILAVIYRSYIALFVVLIIRISTDITDMINATYFSVAQVESSIPIVLVLLVIIPSIGLRYLLKKIKEN